MRNTAARIGGGVVVLCLYRCLMVVWESAMGVGGTAEDIMYLTDD